MELIVWGAVTVSALSLILIALLSKLRPEFYATTTIEEILKEETSDA